MSLPENENLEINEETQEPELENELEAEAEPESTIFSDPAHYNDEPKKEAKKGKYSSLIKLIAVFVAVAVAIGAYVAIDRLVPKPKTEEQKDFMIDVKTASSAHVKEIRVKNENSEYTILPKVVESLTESSTIWTIDGINSDYTDSSVIEDVVNAALDINAVREVTEVSGDLGFDKPTVSIEVIGDGESLQDYTVVIGGNAPAELGCYCKVSGDDKIYIINTETMLALQAVPLDFAVTTGYGGVLINNKNMSCFANGTLNDFDYISISGAKFDKTLTIKPQTDESINAFFAYIITSPVKRIADDDKVSTLMSYFDSGISSVGAYSYTKDAKTLKEYKLDNPDYVVTISLNGEKHTFKFSIVSDLHCALIEEGSDMIHQVALSTLGISSFEVEDYYSSFIILEALSGLSKMKVETPDGKQYSFDLKYTPPAEDGSTSSIYQAFYKGKELDIANFKKYYQKLIALTPISYDSNPNLKTSAKITLVHSSGTGDVVLSFKKYSSGRYQVELDGIPMGLITATAFNELMEATPKAANGETISD